MTGSNQVSNVVSSVVTPVALSGVKTPLLNQFEGAAAAYSLRRLKSWDDGSRVVRVRRESDNTERDFSSVEVSDGTMARWVNEQPTLPLDLRELDTNTGERDGALIEAAAAYSLRKLKEDFTGDVVEVRRNVDGETEGFTADEVTDGTLESFVNASFDDELPLDQATGAAAAYSLRNLSSSYTGDVVEVRRSSDDATQSFTAAEVANGTLTDWVGAGNDGHVKTWYDQSGSDNHATQTDPAKQPKIVEGGNLLTRNGDAAIKSTSDNEMLFTLDSLSADGQQSVFAVLENDITSEVGYGTEFLRVSSSSASSAGANRRPRWICTPTGQLVFTVDSLTGYNNTDREYRLYSHIMNDDAGGTSTIHQDGTQVDTRSITLDANATFSDGKVLGVDTTATGAFYMSEVIYYPSDQSDKRRAIEENIANHYDITLAAFSRDGTVSTWYDQSGSTPSNDAVQTDAAKQPKIVLNGSLVQNRNKPSIKFADDSSDERYLTSPADIGSSFSFFASWQPLADDVTAGSAAAQKRNSTLLYGSGGLYIAGVNADFTNGYRSGANIDSYSAGIDFQKSLNLHTIIEGSADINYFGNGTNEIDGSGDASTSTVTQYYIGSKVAIPTHNTRGYISELIHYNSDQSANRTAIEANIGETYGITAIPAANDTVNGYVQTWYDQSGSGNDATQSTAANQPKIVGEVTSGEPHAFLGAIDFAESGTKLVNAAGGSTTEASVFSVITRGTNTTSGARAVGYSEVSSTAGTLAFTMDNSIRFDGAAATNSTLTIPSSDDFSSTTIKVSNTEANHYLNGAANILNSSLTLSDTDLTYSIGAVGAGTTFNGTVKEAIFYNSDQSSNRTAIETNIADEYGVTLS